MKEIRFKATSPYEIGDVLVTDKGEKKIKEIVCLNYASNGSTEFRYQFDGADDKFYKLPDPPPIMGDLEGLNRVMKKQKFVLGDWLFEFISPEGVMPHV